MPQFNPSSEKMKSFSFYSLLIVFYYLISSGHNFVSLNFNIVTQLKRLMC